MLEDLVPTVGVKYVEHPLAEFRCDTPVTPSNAFPYSASFGLYEQSKTLLFKQPNIFPPRVASTYRRLQRARRSGDADNTTPAA